MNDVWKAIVEEFTDLPGAAQFASVAVRLVLAAVLGGILGYEREKSGKQAGLRTHMMIAVGAALLRWSRNKPECPKTLSHACFKDWWPGSDSWAQDRS